MQLELLNDQGQAASKVDAPETLFGRHDFGGPATRGRDRAASPAGRSGPPRGSGRTPRHQAPRPVDF